MKVLGCFKIVPDLEQVAEEDWIVNDNLVIDTGYEKLQWNYFDVVVELSALTVGTKRHEAFLKVLYALGYQKAVRIEVEEDDYRQKALQTLSIAI